MALSAAMRTWDSPSTSAEGSRRWGSLAKAVRVAQTYLHPRDVAGTRSAKPVETPEITAAFELAIRHGRAAELYQDFTDAVEDRFGLVRQDMETYLSRLESDQAMVEMLERLALWQRAWGVPLKAMNDPKLISLFTSLFHQLVHSSLPASFPAHLRTLLISSLSRLPPSSPLALPLKISPPSQHLSRLGVLPRYSATLSRVAYEEIERIAQQEALKGWDARRLSKARQRVGEGVAGWLGGLFEGNEAAQNALRPMFSRFDYYLCKCFFDIRTDELFDIIVDYPDSMAALEDLKECLFKVDQRSQLVDKLKASNLKRLLHPGAETKDVIIQYISTIRCLRILDPPGVLLHKVAEPIRRHLRDRPDTIKCIVATLVQGEELQDENEYSTGAGVIGQGNEDEAENFLDPKWEPEPIDAAPEFRSGKASDIISTLVSIYQSREVIIKELQVLLATRLLAVKDYDAVKEIRIIELLKIRFGETALQVCDVMLKDMADSKRINDHVQGDLKSTVQPLIISRMFWPNVQSSSLHLPPKLLSATTEYEAAFHHFKPDKHLRWVQHLGTVNIKLELSDRVVLVEATPLQASIAELFEECDEWTLGDIAERLGMHEVPVRTALVWWAGQGVVKEGEKWRLLEVAEEINVHVVESDEPILQQVDEARAEQIRVYWPRINSALTSLGPQTLDGLYKILGSIKGFHQYSSAELGVFLEMAKREGNVDTRGGKWVV